MSDGWTIAAIFAGFSAIMLAVFFYMSRLQGGALELRNANPQWKLERLPHAALRLDDGAGEVFVSEEDAGAWRMLRVDCAEVRTVFPAWFVLPDAPVGACVRLGNAQPYTYALNMRLQTPIPQLWNDLFARKVEQLGLSAQGQWLSGRAAPVEDGENVMDLGNQFLAPTPDGSQSNRLARWMRYRIEPPERSPERQIGIEAFHYGSETQVLFAFRPPRQP